MCAFECRVEACRLSSQKRRSQTKLHVSTARHKRCCCCKRMCRSDECRAESAAVAIYFEPTEEDEIGCGRGSHTSSIVSLVRVQAVIFAHVPRARGHTRSQEYHTLFARKRALGTNLCVSCFVPRACGVCGEMLSCTLLIHCVQHACSCALVRLNITREHSLVHAVHVLHGVRSVGVATRTFRD